MNIVNSDTASSVTTFLGEKLWVCWQVNRGDGAQVCLQGGDIEAVEQCGARIVGREG